MFIIAFSKEKNAMIAIIYEKARKTFSKTSDNFYL
jgi:hypothetical protein